MRSSEDERDNSTVEHDAMAQKDKGIFRAPAKMSGLDSQMCSTPRIFRRRRPHSPTSGLEESPDSGRGTLTL